MKASWVKLVGRLMDRYQTVDISFILSPSKIWMFNISAWPPKEVKKEKLSYLSQTSSKRKRPLLSNSDTETLYVTWLKMKTNAWGLKIIWVEPRKLSLSPQLPPSTTNGFHRCASCLANNSCSRLSYSPSKSMVGLRNTSLMISFHKLKLTWFM